MTRPEDLICAVDERPPWPRLIVLGAQHAVLMSVYLVLIVIVFRSADASHAASAIGDKQSTSNTALLPV